MKMLITYVRPHMAQAVIGALLQAGCEDVLIQEVRRVVTGLKGEEYSFSVTLGQRYEPMTMLIFPAPEEFAPEWARLVQQSATTGHHGDGNVMILPVESRLPLSGRV